MKKFWQIMNVVTGVWLFLGLLSGIMSIEVFKTHFLRSIFLEIVFFVAPFLFCHSRYKKSQKASIDGVQSQEEKPSGSGGALEEQPIADQGIVERIEPPKPVKVPRHGKKEMLDALGATAFTFGYHMTGLPIAEEAGCAVYWCDDKIIIFGSNEY